MTLRKGDVVSAGPAGDTTAKTLAFNGAAFETYPFEQYGQSVEDLIQARKNEQDANGWTILPELNAEALQKSLPSELMDLIQADGQKRKISGVQIDKMDKGYYCIQMITQERVGLRILLQTAPYAQENMELGLGSGRPFDVGISGHRGSGVTEDPESFERKEDEFMASKSDGDLENLFRLTIEAIERSCPVAKVDEPEEKTE